MAVDKLVDSTQLDSDLTSVANAIRTKGGTSGSLAFPAGFVSAIEAISGGGSENFAGGSFTPASNTNSATFYVGFNPDIIAVGLKNSLESGDTFRLTALTWFSNGYSVRAVKSSNNNAGIGTFTKSYSNGNVTITRTSGTWVFAAGEEYFWIAGSPNDETV